MECFMECNLRANVVRAIPTETKTKVKKTDQFLGVPFFLSKRYRWDSIVFGGVIILN